MKHNTSRGFTLLEMAVSILILGLITTPLLVLYNNWIVEERKERTFDGVVRVIERLHDYRVVNGFYPLPAQLTLNRTNAQYGRSIADNCWITPSVGVAAKTSVRSDLPSDDEAYLDAVDGQVCTGFVPFRDLQIEEKDAYDAYGSRLVYSITASMTDINTIDDAAGAISVRDQNGQTMSPLDGNVSFVVLSLGENKAGGFRMSAALHDDCPNLGLESGNCSLANGVDAIYTATFKRNDFDDVVQYFSDNRIPLWQRDNVAIENIRDISPDGVAVGVAEADTELHVGSDGGKDALYVRGDYGVVFPGGGAPPIETNPEGYTGRILLPGGGRICDNNEENPDADDANCIPVAEFKPDALEGRVAMTCGADEIAIGIKDGVLNCVDKASFKIKCPEETPVFMGLNPDGTPICEEMPADPCEPVLYDGDFDCADEISLPGAGDGSFYPGPTEGEFLLVSDCGNVNFVCSDGEWLPNIFTGYCLNFPDDPPDQLCGISCDVLPDGSDNPAPPGGFDETYCMGQQYVCLDDPPDFDPDNPPPIDEIAGLITNQYDHTFGEDCSCAAFDDPQSAVACHTHFEWPYSSFRSGSVEITHQYDGTGEPGECNFTTLVNHDCTCNPPTELTETRTIDCPSGQIGEIDEEREFDPALEVCKWSDWDETDNSCTCDETQTQEWDTDHQCLDSVCEMPDVPDHHLIEVVGTDGEGQCIWGEEQITLGSCKLRPFSWVKVGSSGQEADTVPPGAIIIGDSCSCNDHQNTQGSSTRNCFSSESNIIDFCKCL